MRVLVACEESQVVCKAFRAKGHAAFSCDIQGCSGDHPEWHIKDDVLLHLNDGWDLMIAHPPCTYLCNSGIRWLHEDDSRWAKMVFAADFFKDLLNCNIPRICIENPIMHIYALDEIAKDKDQIVQPYYFGDNKSKETWLWLKNLPRLRSTAELNLNNHIDPEQEVFFISPGVDRPKIRSKTYGGLAAAMADQWG